MFSSETNLKPLNHIETTLCRKRHWEFFYFFFLFFFLNKTKAFLKIIAVFFFLLFWIAFKIYSKFSKYSNHIDWTKITMSLKNVSMAWKHQKKKSVWKFYSGTWGGRARQVPITEIVLSGVYQYIEECTNYEEDVQTLSQLNIKTPNEISTWPQLLTRGVPWEFPSDSTKS